MKHLFLAATDVAAGEVTHAARLARALVTAGDEVVFLLPRALDGMVAELRGRRGWIDDALHVLDRAVLSAVERERPDAVMLVDGASVAQAMVMRGLPFVPFVKELARRARVVALDVWSLDEAGLVVDYGADTFELPAILRELPRLVPVPFARPEVAGGYGAMTAPSVSPERARVRGELGVGDDDRVVLFAIASWQLPHMQLHPARAAVAETVLRDVAALFAALPGTHVVQVGQHSHAALAVLGERLHRCGVVSPARYAELFGAADLMFGTNISATSLISAIAAGLPALVAMHGGPIPLLGMSRFLAPVLAANPYLDAIATCDLTDRDAAIAAATRLLHDAAAIGELRARQASYAARVRELPSALDAYRRLLQ
jgi:hypothetical protein